MRSLFIFTFLYACESWALTAELEKIKQAFEMRYYSTYNRLGVRRKIQAVIGEYDELLITVVTSC